MTAVEQIEKAKALGVAARKAGQRRVPAWDYALMLMISGRKPHRIPKGEAPTVKILEAWVEGYKTEDND